MSVQAGTLYIIATPIGHLGDITVRAQAVLGELDILYAEDTRRTVQLCRHLGVHPRVRSLHEHNETDRIEEVVRLLQEQSSVGLVSDAGTPLISDPGYRLVEACHEKAIPVSPIPGASALTAALCVCGLPTDSFIYLGFTPARQSARLQMLRSVEHEARTLVFFESKHRIRDCLTDMVRVFGANRFAAVARELTKIHETISRAPLQQLASRVVEEEDERLGEFVIVVAGEEVQKQRSLSPELHRLLGQMSQHMPPRKASGLIAEFTNLPRRQVYDLLLQQKKESGQNG